MHCNHTTYHMHAQVLHDSPIVLSVLQFWHHPLNGSLHVPLLHMPQSMLPRQLDRPWWMAHCQRPGLHKEAVASMEIGAQCRNWDCHTNTNTGHNEQFHTSFRISRRPPASIATGFRLGEIVGLSWCMHFAKTARSSVRDWRFAKHWHTLYLSWAFTSARQHCLPFHWL